MVENYYSKLPSLSEEFFGKKKQAEAKEFRDQTKAILKGVAQFYNEFLAVQIKLICEQKHCDPSDLCIFHQMDGNGWKTWIDKR